MLLILERQYNCTVKLKMSILKVDEKFKCHGTLETNFISTNQLFSEQQQNIIIINNHNNNKKQQQQQQQF